MNIVFFDSAYRTNLLPFTFTRPTAELRIGILTIREKWEKSLACKASFLTETYLQKKYPYLPEEAPLFIAGNLLPNQILVEKIKDLKENEGWLVNDQLIAYRGSAETCEKKTYPYAILQICHTYDLFSLNEEEIKNDFQLLTQGRESQPLPHDNALIGDSSLLFIEEGVSIHCAILNTSQGPIYLGKESIVMEGSMIRGPFALCEGSTVKMGSKIYEGTTIGPHCKIGGEVAETIFMGYSNKAHDGYIGHSVVGEWCNIGAGTNCSNLKNDYAEVKLWNYPSQRFLKTGLQHCGLMLGDHTKIGIGVILNTGTVIGIGCNIHGSGFPRNFIPSFQNGGNSGYTLQNLKQFFTTTEKVMGRRGISFDETEKEILRFLFEQNNPQK